MPYFSSVEIEAEESCLSDLADRDSCGSQVRLQGDLVKGLNFEKIAGKTRKDLLVYLKLFSVQTVED